MSSKKTTTRNRILQATLDLLKQSQDSGVRISDIAKKAGITRQAVYLHFASRAELLIAATYYLDDLLGSEERLKPSRNAKTGVERLDAYIEAWGNYIPDIYSIANALIAMSDTDEAAASAWSERMQDMREGCEAAINALRRDKMLSSLFDPEQATDLLWTILSVHNWEQMTINCGWPQDKYIKMQKSAARRLFVKS